MAFQPATYGAPIAGSASLGRRVDKSKVQPKGPPRGGEVSQDRLEYLLRSLRPHANEKLPHLPERQVAEFRELLGHATSLYAHRWQYESFCALIQRYFCDITPQPGTVGGFIAGCLVDPLETPAGSCSPVCAGAIPPPAGRGWSPCDKTVILAEWENGRYSFTILNKGTRPDGKAILYVEGKTAADFHGLTASEKASLANDGITEVQVRGYRNGEPTTTDIGTSTEINAVPTRTETSSSSTTGDAGVIVLAILLGLIAVFVIWFLATRRRT